MCTGSSDPRNFDRSREASTTLRWYALNYGLLIREKGNYVKLIPLLVAAGLLFSGVASAQSGADLVKSKNCMGCHDLDKKKVGPGFQEIAAKNKGSKDAEATLIAKLRDGKGHMKIAASDDELKTLIHYVLSQK